MNNHKTGFTKSMLIHDDDNCIGCGACMIACMDYHHLPADRPIMKIIEKDCRYRLITCRQCGEYGACIKECKNDAISISESGIAVINQKACTGCGACRKVCPFGSVVMVEKFGKPIAVKCMLCRERDDKTPICMQACVMDCIYF